MVKISEKLNKNNFRRVLGVSLLVVLSCCGICYLLTLIPSKSKFAPEQFPRTDIMFNAGGKLGFINADGSQEIYISYQPIIKPFLALGPVSGWGRPLLAGADQYVVFSDGGDGGFPSGWGTIYVAMAGGPATFCKEWETGYVWLAVDQEYLYVNSDQGVAKYLPSDCGTDNAPMRVFPGVQGPLSPDEKYVAMVSYEKESSHTPIIIILELETGTERMIAEGDFPAWSRDGQWLAYTGADGIYVVKINTESVPKQIIAHQNNNPSVQEDTPLYFGSSRPSVYFPPTTSWSPDGDWLVYSLFNGNQEEDVSGEPSFYSIYKLSIKTGKETKIVEGGLSPYWRWPIESQR